jgi:hypothetical protein
MTGKKLQRLLACLLAVLLLSQVGAFSPAVFAADDSSYTLQNGTAIIKSDMSVDEVNHALTRALVKDFDQMSEDQQAKLLEDLKWEYKTNGFKNKGTIFETKSSDLYWDSIAGGRVVKEGKYIKTEYTCPALNDNSDGTYQVRVADTTQEVTLTKAEKLSSSITLKQGASVKLPYKEDGTLDFDALRENIFSLVVESTKPELTVNDVTITYYATSKVNVGHKWAALEGDTLFPAISAGEQKIKVSYSGSDDYKAATVETTVNFLDRAAAPFTRKEGVTEVAMVYNKDQSINYEATAQALREALLVSADSNVSINDVTVEYNAGIGGIKNYQPLNYSPTGSDFIDQLVKFGRGSQTIRFTWRGNADYQAYTAEVTVEMTDSREASTVVLKPSISLIYNKDAAAMTQQIFEYVIDWDDSTLPDKSTLSADDFTIEYYATAKVVAGDFSGDMNSFKDWVSIEGKGVKLGDLQLLYPQMGAGEQQIRVTFNGGETYRPSEAEEGSLTVKKANVSVKVHSTSIYADEVPGEGFVTTDPVDDFDIFTVYTGVSSVFVQLPERYTDNAFIKVVDPVLEKVGLRTIKDIMDKGITVGELKQNLDKIANGSEYAAVREALKLMGVDVATLQQIINVFNKITLLDNVRIALRTPDQVGIYTVYAITNNDNYNTGFGMGALVVKKHYSGVKLDWNQNFTNGKISAADVKNFNFGATLSYNGDQVEDQSSVHYLYSGFTSKWRPYSSTTTPPTAPGRYVVTVVTLGGNYQAAPITRAFQITK